MRVDRNGKCLETMKMGLPRRLLGPHVRLSRIAVMAVAAVCHVALFRTTISAEMDMKRTADRYRQRIPCQQQRNSRLAPHTSHEDTRNPNRWNRQFSC